MVLESYVNSGKMRSLHPILKNWIETIGNYLDYFNFSDGPWWFNESRTYY